MDDLFSRGNVKLPFALPRLTGFSALWDDDKQGFNVKIPGGEFFYAERFFSSQWSDRAVEFFQENDRADWRAVNWRDLSSDEIDKMCFTNIKWKQDYIKLYGKSIPLPRLTSWYGDEGKSYQYSGIKSDPHPWNSGLAHIKNKIEECAEHVFNCVLLNWYRDGSDSLNWHADDERELGSNPVIASANFGETRDFLVRKNNDPAVKMSIPLKHGTLLIMRGAMQHHWQHSIPKRAGVARSRFNLTFRTIN